MASKKKKAKRPVGRPLKLDAAILTQLLAALQAGAYIETAAAYAGLNKDTFYAWLKRGRAAKEKALDVESGEINQRKIPKIERAFVEFSDAIEKALADSELLALQQIGAASLAGAWQAAAWRLERKFPQRYGRRAMATASLAIGEGQIDNGKNQGQAGQSAPESPAAGAAPLDPRNPPVLHLTLAIGDREIDADVED